MLRISMPDATELMRRMPVLDVRSPGEYGQAHVPGAYSLPLFSDEERKVVGTLYKQQGRQPAIKKGLDYFGLKMSSMVNEVEQLMQSFAATKKHSSTEPDAVLVHCWRGGMRSAGVSWLLGLYGFKVYTLNGGYKAYRNWVLQQFALPYQFRVLGGYTGSGKTRVLQQMAKSAAVIDLEGIAHHKGSAFGGLGETPQPRQEMFENELAHALYEAGTEQPAWIEDESRRIGNINLPAALWETMRKAPVYFLDIPFEQRLDYLAAEYGKFRREDLINATVRLQKRLGGLNTKNAIGYLLEDNKKEAFRILLRYYDKFYSEGLTNRENLQHQLKKISTSTVEAAANARLVLASQ